MWPIPSRLSVLAGIVFSVLLLVTVFIVPTNPDHKRILVVLTLVVILGCGYNSLARIAYVGESAEFLSHSVILAWFGLFVAFGAITRNEDSTYLVLTIVSMVQIVANLLALRAMTVRAIP